MSVLTDIKIAELKIFLLPVWMDCQVSLTLFEPYIRKQKFSSV